MGKDKTRGGEMGKKQPQTPNYKIKDAIRKLWLRSRERAAALKREGYTCEICGKKQSVSKNHPQKVEVHHREGCGNWQAVYDIIRQEILCDPGWLEVLCPECHKRKHEE